MTPDHGLMLLVGAALGAAGGSYATTFALRFSRGELSSRGRSHCDGCDASLSFVRTVPVVSFAWARGVCHCCGGRIDPIHLAGELAGIVVVLSALALTPWPYSMGIAALGLVLLALAVTDHKCGRLPNPLTLAVTMVGAMLAARAPDRLLAGLVAAFIASGCLLALRQFARTPNNEASIGLGDVKLVFGLALWLGALTPWMVAAASGVGLAVASATKVRRIRFGPYLCSAGWLIGLAGERLHGG